MSFVSAGIAAGSLVFGAVMGNQEKQKALGNAALQRDEAIRANLHQQVAEAAAAKRAADDAAARAIINNANTKAKKAQTNRLIIGISVVGGTVLTIATIMVVALRRK